MKTNIKFAAALSTFGSPGDRFMSGYKQDVSISRMFELAAQSGLCGLEFVYENNIMPDNKNEVKDCLHKYNMQVFSVLPNLFGKKEYARGSITSRDKAIREQAKDEIRKVMDVTRELGGNLVNIWAGQDGYDYPFESDYIRVWEQMIDDLREVAGHNPSIRLGLEYKFKEPRVNCYISTVSKALLLAEAIDKPNVGVILDTGHAHLSYENAAESVAFTRMFGNRLFGLHINDTRPDWDWDLNVGAVHFLPTLEWLWWVDRIDYDGLYCLDIWPARMDSVAAVKECIEWINAMRTALMRIGDGKMREIMERGDTVLTMRTIREAVFR
jgi:xylose isomerase